MKAELLHEYRTAACAAALRAAEILAKWRARLKVREKARFDLVSQPTGFPDATGFTLTIGYKRYF